MDSRIYFIVYIRAAGFLGYDTSIPCNANTIKDVIRSYVAVIGIKA